MNEQGEEQGSGIDKRVAINAYIGKVVNLAQQQHDFPFLHQLKIENMAKEPLDGLVLRISANPEFLTGRKWRFDHLAPHEEMWVEDLDVRLSYSYLAGLGEAVKATVCLEAFVDDQAIGSWAQTVRVLSPEEWGGLDHLPDLTAAFCLPNDPAVEKVLKIAAQALKRAGKGGALDGYQSKNRNKVWNQVSAIYSAICSLNLDYASPPASFERVGQKIRIPSRILDSGLGTCLDLALFMAACFEQCGLNPLLILTEGHAFAGCWLVETDFSSTVVDDCQSVRKRQDLGEMVLVEATAVTQQPPPSFRNAANQGNRHLDVDEKFRCALDISRARMNAVTPLAIWDTPGPVEIAETAIAENNVPVVEDAPELPNIEIFPEDTKVKPDTPDSRVEQWKRKLLDLTLRNKLLNFKSGKKTVPIFCPDPARLEDMLADDNKFKFVPLPEIMEGHDPRSKELHRVRHGDDAKKQFAQKALERKELLVDLTSRDMEYRLVGLYRQARREMEEGGANTLFLAMGFLKWTQADVSSRELKAPLLLLPVYLERVSVRTGYKLFLHEDDPCLNPTLLEMLRRDFHLDLSNLNDNLPRDQSGLDVHKIWHTVRRYVRDMKGWEVTEDVYLGTFSFTKYLMWKDLQDRLGQLKENPIVRHLIEDPHEPYQGSGEFPDCKGLDDEYKPDDIYCPLSADSSQLAAILAAAQGKDFVVVGPPGTGKSQTITNMIVQCLVEGKTVLFLSQKMAALDVVYRRLQQVGMGAYCLELHSSKARKADVLAQLESAWNAREAYDDQEWREKARRLCALRKRLNQYPKRLHKRYPNGLTPYAALGLVIANQDTPALRFFWPSHLEHNKEELERLRDLVSSLAVNAETVGELSRHPLKDIQKEDWSPVWQQELQEKAEELRKAIGELQDSLEGFIDSLGMNNLSGDQQTLTALCELAKLLPLAADKSYAFAFSDQAQPTIQQMEQQTVSCGMRIEQLEQRIADRSRIIQQLERQTADRSRTIQQLERQTADRSKTIQQLERQTVDRSRTIQQLERQTTDHSYKIGNLRGELSLEYRSEIMPLLDELECQWQTANQAWWLKSYILRRVAAKRLGTYASSKALPKHTAIPNDLAALKQIKAERSAIETLEDEIRAERSAIETLEDEIRAERSAIETLEDEIRAERSAIETLEDEIRAERSAIETLEDEIRAERSAIENMAETGKLLGSAWRGLDTDWTEVHAALKFADGFLAILGNLSGGNLNKRDSLRNQLKHLAVDGDELLAEGGLVRRKAEQVIRDYKAFSSKLASACTCVATDSPDALADPESPQWLADLNTTMEGWIANLSKLNAWCGWRKACSQAMRVGLGPLVAALRNGDIEPDQTEHTFRVNYCRWWLTLVIDADDVLRTFRGAEHERYIKDFKKLDDDMLSLTSRVARGRISGAIPSQQECDARAKTEWGVLKREITKKRRHMPLRKLIESLPHALTKLTPCLLMSPLSVAQYLSPSTALFDVVIFDEASQIPVWDAVGALARGRQAIVVGDPKQLPPTSFFMRSDDEEDLQEWEVEDLESILDECQGANLPNLYLRWHYRSRHESLIVFSNQKYYRGELITFPSASTKDEAVRYFHVPDGQYEKGKARVNHKEAEAVVQAVLQWLRDPEFVREGWSLGVVTFNQQQQMLIEDLLDQQRRKDPKLEQHFSPERHEPVFVKNLENVQGDERDIILFSLTYGPDAAGRVSMNFGPLNKDGGERRLNVAITRARRALHVYGTLKADHIDLSRTKAVGVRHFKHFLEFAERGPHALAGIATPNRGDYDSPFEQEVAAELQKRGWIVHPQVGVSGFRVDLGVVHPETPGRYLAGVECDGATYHSSATARDRDRLREAVLRELGWNIVRVWSTDWWVDRRGETEKLHKKLNELLASEKKKQKDNREAWTERHNESCSDIECLAPDDAKAVQPQNLDSHVVEPKRSRGYASSPPPTNPEPLSPDAQQAVYRVASPSPGRLVLPEDLKKDFWAEEFYNRSHSLKIREMIREVVETEGPVALKLVIERVARAHGFKRIGTRIEQRISRLTKDGYQKTKERGQVFLWPRNSDPRTWSGFRINPDGQPPLRPVEMICMKELVNLALYVRDVDYPLDEQELMKGMANRLGYKKLTKKLESTLRKALIKLREN